MSNLERIENRLGRLVAQLESEGKDANQRVKDAVADCLLPDIDDKLREDLYRSCRTQATLQGYGDYLPKSGERGGTSAIQPTLDSAKNAIVAFVAGGIQASPDVLAFLFRKKNKEGLIYYTEDTLADFLYNSSNRRLEDDYKDKKWDGLLDSLMEAYRSSLEETPQEDA